jgi:hypothetical protein
MFSTDGASERATSIEDYQNTCCEFIVDISKDYRDWVDRYQLGEEETSRRKATINGIVKTTNEWMRKFGTDIKKVDIIMNDGVNKMAENTAGYPFRFDVFVNGASRYVMAPLGEVKMNLKVMPRPGRQTRIGNYQKDQLMLLNSSSPVSVAVSKESTKAADLLDDYVILDARGCKKYDVISLTVVVEEINGDYVAESRGYSTLVLLT